MSRHRIGYLWKKYLPEARSSELMVFLFFLLLSTAFWFAQAMQETVDKEIHVPLFLDNVPHDIQIIDTLQSDVTVTVHDKGYSILLYTLFSEEVPIVIDFTKFENSRRYGEVIITSQELLRLAQQQMETQLHAQSVSPDTIRFSFNRGMPRRLPVRPGPGLTAASEHYIQHVSFTPDSVLVYAPAERLDTMHAVYTQPFNGEEISSDDSRKVQLLRQRMVRYEPSTVRMQVRVGRYVEKVISVPIVAVNFPASKKLRTFPSRTDITCVVKSECYDDITADDFTLSISYEELLSDTVARHILQLRDIPDGVRDARINDPVVEYLIDEVQTEPEP